MANKDFILVPRVEVEDINTHRTTVRIKADKNYATVIKRRLAPYKSLPRDFKPALEAIADYVRGVMIVRTFKEEGPGWAPLRPRTVRERIQKGYSGEHPILVRSGDLLKELTDRSHPKHIEVVKVGKNARVEVGGSSTKFVENQLGKSSQHLPARPMIPGTGNIPLNDRDRLEIKKILDRAVLRKRK